MATLSLHGTKLSGHTHRVEAFLRLLGLPYEYRDAPADVRRTPAFLALNPLGQIPVLEDGELVLADSCAILVYLARRYDPSKRWLPDDPVGAARVQRWLSIAAGELAYGPAAARVITLWKRSGGLEWAQATARTLLTFMDAHLDGRAWLAAEHATIADVAVYAYVAHAPEGGVDLTPYPAVRAWIARVEDQPGWLRMEKS